ncbi:MAG: hypothetical protein KAT30_05305, partial [Candidatus Krumholzibacteria bacterium]|nr:hypothetical protein [Candidatus Krumholzibacteria bacterium]
STSPAAGGEGIWLTSVAPDESDHDAVQPCAAGRVLCGGCPVHITGVYELFAVALSVSTQASTTPVWPSDSPISVRASASGAASWPRTESGHSGPNV